MPEPLADALAELRPLLLDPARLVRAVAAGRRHGQARHAQTLRRAELRPVDLKGGRALQIVTYDERTATTRNLGYDDPAAAATVDELLGRPFGNWHVRTSETTVQLRVTKKGLAQVHREPHATPAADGPEPVVAAAHDRRKPRLLDPADPLFRVLGAGGDKRRQVEAFLRVLAPAVEDAWPQTDVGAAKDGGAALRMVDLGCGNAYLTFAAHRFLTGAGRDVVTTGVDVKAQAREHNSATAATLQVADRVRFVEGTILAAPVSAADVVLALHACDTATDEALARAVGWDARLVLAAPCCHHDLQRQLRQRGRADVPAPYALLARHGALRERFADVLTDALRAAVLRMLGYRVEVLEFVDSRHTPRNTLIRAVRTEAAPDPAQVADYRRLCAEWGVRPRLAELLADRLAPVLAATASDAPRDA